MISERQGAQDALWILYRDTGAAEKALEQAFAQGKVVLAPSDGARKGTAAIVLDPSGAPIALQKWPV